MEHPFQENPSVTRIRIVTLSGPVGSRRSAPAPPPALVPRGRVPLAAPAAAPRSPAAGGRAPARGPAAMGGVRVTAVPVPRCLGTAAVGCRAVLGFTPVASAGTERCHLVGTALPCASPSDPTTSRPGRERRRRMMGWCPACGVCLSSSPSCVSSFSFSSSPFWISCCSPSCGAEQGSTDGFLHCKPLQPFLCQTPTPAGPSPGLFNKGEAIKNKEF